MDSLMSAISDVPPPPPTTVKSTSCGDIPVVTAVTNTDQGEEPVVMLTASQLQQLGINVNVVQSPGTKGVLDIVHGGGETEAVLYANARTPGRTADTVVFTDTCTPDRNPEVYSDACTPVRTVVSESLSGPSVTSVEANIPTRPSVNTESLIGHAFSEATGISLDDLGDLSRVSNVLHSMPASTCVEESGPVEGSGEDLARADVEAPAEFVEVETEEQVAIPTLEQLVDGMKDTEEVKSPAGVHADRTNDDDVPDENDVSSAEIPTLEQLVGNMEQAPLTEDSNQDATQCQEHQVEVDEEVQVEPETEQSNVETAEKSLETNESVVTKGVSVDNISHDKPLSPTRKDTIPRSGPSTPPNYMSPPPPPRSVSKEHLVDESPTKSAIRMMAELAQLISPKSKSSSSMKWPHQHRSSLKYRSPSKNLTAKPSLRPILPLGELPTTPVKLDMPAKLGVGPGRPRQSPLKKDLNQQARSIAPKGFVVRSYISPVKVAAACITAKVRRKNQPKPPAVRKLRTLLPRKTENDNDQNLDDDFDYLDDDEDGDYDDFRTDGKNDVDLDCLSGSEAGIDSPVDDDDLDDVADEDEDRLAELMAASTTVRLVFIVTEVNIKSCTMC